MKNLYPKPKTRIFTRLAAGLLCILTLIPLFACPVSADTSRPDVERCSAAVLYNFENDQTIYEYKSRDRAFPGSSVKLMTALVAFDAFGDNLAAQITVTGAMLAEVTGNSIDFYEGEVVTAEEMLNCMLVNSANDAAIVLAHAAAGSTAAFVERMNDKAAELGLMSSVYTNVTGMHDPKMTTTAADVADVCKACYAIPGFVDITSQQKYTMPPTNFSDERVIFNRNAMISKYYSTGYLYDAVVGLNAGATAQGGYNLTAVAKDEESGLTYLAVVLGAEEYEGFYYSYVNGKRMFDWAFGAYGYRSVLAPTQVICELPVRLSSTVDFVTLVPKEALYVYLPTETDLAEAVKYSYNTVSDAMSAPIEAGEEAGMVTVLYEDEIIGAVPLVTTASVTRSEFLYFLDRVTEFTRSRFFKGTIAAIIVLSVLYVFIKAALREKRIRRMSGRR
ncbi:MAG: D-alanyl-D-alanine carboxypeptidase [Clostridia bacterium]|nr:D-alanyl-D-alanine carboxypeptidase [Clostridia bacterium]